MVFVVGRPLIPHGHARTLAWLRQHYHEESESLADGTPVSVFDLGRTR
jgi:hypothetical protein